MSHRRAMARHTAQKFKVDDLAFPIRLKIVVPDGGLRCCLDMVEWLNKQLGPARWASGPAQSSGCRQATAYYFRSLADAQRCLDAFPQLQLADGVDQLGYSAVYREVPLEQQRAAPPGPLSGK